jgi:hypothetical protein
MYKRDKIYSNSLIAISNIYIENTLLVLQSAVSSRQHLCILHTVDNLSHYTAVDPFIV